MNISETDLADKIKTDEDVFEFVKNHLLTQGTKSGRDDIFGCVYYSLDPEGSIEANCAVGCLIAPQAYDDSIESESCDNGLVIDAILESLPNLKMNDSTIALLLALQMVHDIDSPDEWNSILSEGWEFNNSVFTGYNNLSNYNKLNVYTTKKIEDHLNA